MQDQTAGRTSTGVSSAPTASVRGAQMAAAARETCRVRNAEHPGPRGPSCGTALPYADTCDW